MKLALAGVSVAPDVDRHRRFGFVSGKVRMASTPNNCAKSLIY